MFSRIILKSKISRLGIMSVVMTLIAHFILYSCIDDLKDNDPYNVPESIGRIVIRVPNSSASLFDSTRDIESEPTVSEGHINSLWMFAFPVGNNGEIFIKQLIGDNELNVTDSEEDDVYKKYEISDIKDGTYHFYFLANLEDYLDETSKSYLEEESTAQESDIQGLVLNFAETTTLAKKIESGNLPMACLSKKVKIKDETGVKKPQEEITITNSKSTEIYADLHFLCSKVRYTILFDKSENGFSQKFSDTNIDFETPHATSIKSKTDVTPETLKDEVKYLSQEALELKHVNIPIEYQKDKSIENLIFEEGTWGEQAEKKAWQGTVYLPENIQPSKNDKKTKIIFPAKGTNVQDEYELILLSEDYADLNGSDNPDWSGIERGYFYDIVITMEKPYQRELPMEVEVKNWDLESLSYELNGITDLTVDKTTVSVTAGETTILNYSTDSGKKVECKSPVYIDAESKETDFYLFKVNDDGTIEITVNPEVPIGLSKEELKKYDFFHVYVGNLWKKIKVDPLVFEPYLNVSPNSINISLQQYISSGIYSTTLPITFDTNIDGLKMTVEDLSNNSELTSNNNQFYLGTNGDDGILTVSGDVQNKKSGSLVVFFKGLNQGYTYWQSSHSYKLVFSVTYKDSTGIDITLSEEVIINVQPYTTDYIIHFRSIDDTWDNPHVFIFQPLELPADIKGPDGNLSPYAGWPVGWEDQSVYPSVIRPCYEYIFTMGIVFKGWSGYGGPTENNPKVSTTETEGFAYGWTGDNKYWVFHDSHQGRSYYNDNTNENRQYSDSRFFREVHTNFNHEQRFTETNKVCEYCTALNLRPGICMFKEEFEGETWWTYILSGVATPGKAKILFSNGHGYHPDHLGDENWNNYPWDKNKMYPKDEYDGVPLFDFPDNEGWFLYDPDSENNEFVNERPTAK